MSREHLGGLEILIVEDDPLLRKQLVAHLDQLGADVTGAETLATARQLIAGLDIDFAIVDLNLPDGQRTALLREKVFGQNTGVIVMTANGDIAGAVEAIRLGALDYLVKPFDPPNPSRSATSAALSPTPAWHELDCSRRLKAGRYSSRNPPLKLKWWAEFFHPSGITSAKRAAKGTYSGRT